MMAYAYKVGAVTYALFAGFFAVVFGGVAP